MDPRESFDDRITPQSNPNVFDDEFAVESPSSDVGVPVADGIRPGRSSGSSQERSARHDPPRTRSSLRRSFSADAYSDSEPRTAVSRNSTQKGGHGHSGSFGIAHEGSNAPVVGRAPSVYSQRTPAPALLHRASTASSASFATMARSQSPFSHTGPSHPYGMYPQGTGVARSASVTTASTVRAPQRPFSNHNGPTHPYAMYPQNVFEDPDELSPSPITQAIPVGFPGLATSQYHRQLGPDGEEQDIIGPDGHTEQLPPYSRYPEEGPTKASEIATAAAASAEAMAATANHSQDTLINSSPRSEQRASADGTALTVPESLRSEETGASEKTFKEKSWKEKRKHRVICGIIPLWMILVGLIVVIILAVVLGAVIGGFLTKEHITQEQATSPAAVVTVVTTASLFDASMITATPTNLPPLPTGTFAISITVPQEEQHDCLMDDTQFNAWSCDMHGPPIEIDIRFPPGGQSDVTIQPGPVSPDAPLVDFGTAPFHVGPEDVDLVMDLDDTGRGPAFHFQTFYDKLVVVGVDEFAAGQPFVSKRNAKPYDPNQPTGPDFFIHETEPGDKFWYCFWNHTFIEGFIYVESNSSLASAASTCTTSSSPPPTPAPSSSSYSKYSTTSYTTSSSSWMETEYLASATSYEKRSQQIRRDDGDDDEDDHHAPFFPYVVKIEERRLPDTGATTPYCQLMTMLDNYQIVMAPANTTETAIIVKLNEKDPPPSAFNSDTAPQPSSSYSSSKRDLHQKLRNMRDTGWNGLKKTWRREEPSNSCHCQWVTS